MFRFVAIMVGTAKLKKRCRSASWSKPTCTAWWATTKENSPIWASPTPTSKAAVADRSTISELISESHRLGARVIVSYVDDPRAIDLHWSSGADYLQGNFIQRPLEDMDYDFSQVVM